MNSFQTLSILRQKQSTPRSLAGKPVRMAVAEVRGLAVGRVTVQRTFVVTQIWGMHARPCAMLVRALEPFDCEVTVQNGEHFANGRSILGLLSLAAGCHSKLKFTVTGEDADRAMTVIEHLFETGFEQVYAQKQTATAGSGVN